VVNPWLVVGGAAALFGGGLATGWRANGWRHDSQQLVIERAAQAAGEKAATAAATAIGGLRPQFTTINKGIERETIYEPVYRDCQHSDATWGLLDQAYQAAGGQPLSDPARVPDATTTSGP
jgi:hypothetical protein